MCELLLQNASRKSVGRTSYGGLGDMFETPAKVVGSPVSNKSTPASTGTPDSVLYAELPDTPNGPGEMFVSPMSTGKKSRKSANLVGVKELFQARASKTPASPTGVKRLMKTPTSAKVGKAAASPTGVAQLFSTPVQVSLKCHYFYFILVLKG